MYRIKKYILSVLVPDNAIFNIDVAINDSIVVDNFAIFN